MGFTAIVFACLVVIFMVTQVMCLIGQMKTLATVTGIATAILIGALAMSAYA